MHTESEKGKHPILTLHHNGQHDQVFLASVLDAMLATLRTDMHNARRQRPFDAIAHRQANAAHDVIEVIAAFLHMRAESAPVPPFIPEMVASSNWLKSIRIGALSLHASLSNP